MPGSEAYAEGSVLLILFAGLCLVWLFGAALWLLLR